MRLFDPVDVGSCRLPNRIAVTAMVTRLSGEDGLVNDAILERYTRFAEGGSGLVVVEASSVHGGKSGPLLKISSDEFIPGMAKLASRVHAAGPGKVFLQIIHFLKIARSGWRQTVGDLDGDQVTALPGLFAAAASRAQRAGLDGVELHMAHAYTLSSFLSRRNKRHDDYGGSLENRLRLPTQVYLAVREAVGDRYPVGVRFDAEECIKDGYSLSDAAEFAIRFAQLGVAYVSLSAGGKFEDAVHHDGEPLYPYTGYSGDRCMPGDGYPDLLNMYLARGVRQALRARGLDTPVIGTGKVPNAEVAEQVLADGSADIVGMARALLADAYWPRKLLDGRGDEIVQCIYCNVCKSLDERFRTVTCYLWPRGAVQPPRPEEVQPAALHWPPGAPLRAEVQRGHIRLRWNKPAGTVGGYDVFRAEDGVDPARITSTTGANHRDDTVVSGRRYRYFVVAYDRAGLRGLPSNPAEAELPAIETTSG